MYKDRWRVQIGLLGLAIFVLLIAVGYRISERDPDRNMITWPQYMPRSIEIPYQVDDTAFEQFKYK